MDWTLDAVPSVQRDLVEIARHIRQSAKAKGEPAEKAFSLAEKRVEKIRASARGLTKAPYQGTRLPHLGPSIRRVTKDRAILYFDLIEDRHLIRILAIFFGGQDHDSRILARLLSPG